MRLTHPLPLSIFALACIAALGTVGFGRYGQAHAPDETLRFRKYFRVQVSLTHLGNEPVMIDFVMGCGVIARQFLAQPTDYAYARMPMVFGVRTKGGQGVLSETPDVCDYGEGESEGRSLDKRVPPDYLPIIFHAENADDLESMTAYFSERAYDQPFSKLKFDNATVKQVTEAEYDDWLKTAPPNIVPVGPRNGWDQNSFFNGGIFPESDYRHGNQIVCQSLRRYRIPEEMRAKVRAQWPVDRPTYWVSQMNPGELFDMLFSPGTVLVGSRDDRLVPPGEFDNGLGGIGKGLRRRGGQGAILTGDPNDPNTGLADRMPVWNDVVNSKRDPEQPIGSVRYFITTSNGADQGFGACYRRYAPWSAAPKLRQSSDSSSKIYIDGKLVGKRPTIALSTLDIGSFPLFERDEFLLGYSTLQLMDEFTRQQ